MRVPVIRRFRLVSVLAAGLVLSLIDSPARAAGGQRFARIRGSRRFSEPTCATSRATRGALVASMSIRARTFR